MWDNTIKCGTSGYLNFSFSHQHCLPYQETTGKTPAKLMLGRQLHRPLERLILGLPALVQPSYNWRNRTYEVNSRMKVQQARQIPDITIWRKDVCIRRHPLSLASNKCSAKIAHKWLTKRPAKIKKLKMGPINFTVRWGDPLKTENVNVVNLKCWYRLYPPRSFLQEILARLITWCYDIQEGSLQCFFPIWGAGIPAFSGMLSVPNISDVLPSSIPADGLWMVEHIDISWLSLFCIGYSLQQTSNSWNNFKDTTLRLTILLIRLILSLFILPRWTERL